MRVTTIKTEATVGALADRMFVNLTPETRKRAEAALLKANPHLAQAEKLQPGMVVNVPEVSGIKIKTTELGKDPVGDVLDGLGEAVAGYQEHLMKRLEAAQADLGSQQEMLKQKELAAAIKATPGAADVAKSLAASLRVREKTIDEDRKRVKAVFDAIVKDIASLK